MSSKTHRVIVNSPEKLQLAKKLVSEMELAEPWEVSIKPFRRNRSQEQNKLYWAHLHTCVAGGIGHDSAEELHDFLKGKFLVPLLQEVDEEFQQDVQMCRDLWLAGKKDKAEFHKNRLFKRASTTYLNVTQFGRYLELVESYTSQYGFTLPEEDSK